jgi:hypothetical protein
MQGLGQKQNDAYQNLSNEAIMAGGTEAQRMFGMESAYRGQSTDEQQRAADFFNASGQQQFGQGMMAGTQAFQNTKDAANFQNQARDQAMKEQQNILGYNQNTQYRMADYYNQLRQQAMNEGMTQRGQALNEVNALLAGQQVGLPQFNSFSNAGAAQATQYLGAANLTGQQNAAIASAENQMMNNLMSGVGSAAGMMAMSDRRLKRNIRRIGERNGTPWYEFDYVWGEKGIGVMADEAPAAAVHIHPSGYLMVDYSKV